MSAFDEDVLKLNGDLNVVADKVKLAREMILGGMKLDDGLNDVIGFLESCRDRMPDLINAGASGLLSEDDFARCLAANDAIQKTLDGERNNKPIEDVNDGIEAIEGNIQHTDDIPSSGGNKAGGGDNVENLLGDDSPRAVINTAIEEPLGGLSLQPPSSNQGSIAAMPPQAPTAAIPKLAPPPSNPDIGVSPIHNTTASTTSNPTAVEEDFDAFLNSLQSPANNSK